MASKPRSKSIARKKKQSPHNPIFDLEETDFRNKLVGKNGREGPKHIMQDAYVIVEDIEGLQVHETLSFQGWLEYINVNWNEVNEYLVNWFYEHVQIEYNCRDLDDNPCGVIFRVALKQNGNELVYEYTSRDFKDDFNASDAGYTDYGFVRNWNCDFFGQPSYEEMVKKMNQGDRPLPESENAKGVLMSCLDGNDKLLLKILKDVVLPTKNSDGDLSKIHAVVLYLLKRKKKVSLPVMIAHHIAFAIDTKQSDYAPYGGLITHIMKYWDIRRPGPRFLPAPLAIGASTYGRQLSIRVKDRLVAKWEEDLLSEEDKAEYDRIAKGKKKKRSTSRPYSSAAAAGEQQQQAFQQEAPQVPDQQGGEGSSHHRQLFKDQFEHLRQRQMEFEANLMDFNNRQQQFELQQQTFQQQQEQVEQRRLESDQRHARGIQGIRRFLRCFGRRSGASEEDLHHLDSD